MSDGQVGLAVSPKRRKEEKGFFFDTCSFVGATGQKSHTRGVWYRGMKKPFLIILVRHETRKVAVRVRFNTNES